MRNLIFLISFLSPILVFSNTIVHEDDFNDCANISWNSIPGVNDTESYDTWKCSTFNGRTYMGIYDNDGNNDDDWLISPAFDLDSYKDEYFSFEFRNSAAIEGLTLLYSTNYSGANTAAAVNSATWNSINLEIFDIHNDPYTSNYSFHKAIDLSHIRGNAVYIAFHFNSTSSTQGWSIDNVRLTADYYQNITNLVDAGEKCSDLKTELHKLIRGHQRIEYTASSYDVWDAFYVTDRRLNDAGTDWIVYDMYSDNPNGPEPYEFTLGEDKDYGVNYGVEGVFYNREHVFAKSWWGGATSPTDSQYTDIHHIVPSDQVVNRMKSNHPMGETLNPTQISMNGCKKGLSALAGYTDTIFVPIEEYKGDYARMLFYFITRYQYKISDWSSNYPEIMSPDIYQSFEPWLLENLVCWHEIDPVSQKEIDRNNAIYSIQKNRNPFIDNPDFVEFIWGTCGSVECAAPTLPVELSSFKGKALPEQQSLLTWETASEINSSHFEVQHSLDGIRFHTIGTVEAQGSSSKNLQYQFTHEEAYSGINYYRLKTVDSDRTFEMSAVITIEHSSGKWIELFPTLAHEKINIKWTNPQNPVSLTIHDLQGKVMDEQVLENNVQSSVNIAHLNPGMYFVSCKSGSLVETIRIFVR